MSDTEEKKKKNLKARKEPTVQSNYDGRGEEENSGQEHGAEFAAAPAGDLLTVYTPVRNKGGCSTIGRGEKRKMLVRKVGYLAWAFSSGCTAGRMIELLSGKYTAA
jgi:hypothetical protein